VTAEWERTSELPTRGEWIPLVVLCTPIAGASLLSKFGVPGFASVGISIALPMIAASLALGTLSNYVRIEPRRCAFFCIMLATLLLPQLLQAGLFSVTSLLMLTAVHLPYVLVVTGGHERVQQVLRFFLHIATLLACCAVAQYFLQSFIDPAMLFPIDNLVPDAFVVQGFNGQGTIHYGSTLLRANGVFMLEPSFLTQFLAVAIVAEAIQTKRLLRLALYGMGIIVAHAGTGIMILMVCLPLEIVVHRRWQLLALGIVGLIVLLAFGDALQLDMITNRANEFSDPNSSGFARFVGGFYMFEQMLWPEPARALFGYGAGAFTDYAHLFYGEVSDMPLTKMLFEYGIVGASIYFAFIASCLFSSPLPKLVSLAIALTFLLNGMYVPFSHGLALGLLVLTSKPAGHGAVQAPGLHAVPA
jgi:hypothetical protein